MKKMLVMCLFAIFFVGCASGFKSFYNPWFNENYFPQEAYLKEGEEPVLMITKINGRKIYTTADFVDIRNASNIGDTWKMTIIRNGKPYKISLRFGL